MTGLMRMVKCLVDIAAAAVGFPPKLEKGECQQMCAAAGGSRVEKS